MKFFQKKEQDEESGVPKPVSYVVPGILVTTLFFLWGFSYGLLDTLNKHFRNVLGICKSIDIYIKLVSNSTISHHTNHIYAGSLFRCLSRNEYSVMFI